MGVVVVNAPRNGPFTQRQTETCADPIRLCLMDGLIRPE